MSSHTTASVRPGGEFAAVLQVASSWQSAPQTGDPARRQWSPEWTCRRLHGSDCDTILHLRQRVLTTLRHPDCYVREADETQFVLRHCAPEARSFGVFEGTRLIAYGMSILPKAGTHGKMELASCMVLPEYQGQGLQGHLIAARLDAGRAEGISHYWAMVSPHNLSSRGNLEMAGFRCAWTGNVNGLWRHIMRFHESDSPDSRCVELSGT